MGASPTTPDTFSSSRRFKHAALGLRLRSEQEREGGNEQSQYKEIKHINNNYSSQPKSAACSLTSDLLF